MELASSALNLTRRTALQLSGAAVAAAVTTAPSRDHFRLLCLSEPATFRPAPRDSVAQAIDRGTAIASLSPLSMHATVRFGCGQSNAALGHCSAHDVTSPWDASWSASPGLFGAKPRYGSSELGPVHLVWLDTVGSEEPGDPVAASGLESRWSRTWQLGSAQLDWLEADLAAVPRSWPVVICSHAPLFEVYRPWNWCVQDGWRALELLERFDHHVTVCAAPRRAAMRSRRPGWTDICLPSLAHPWPQPPGFTEAGWSCPTSPTGTRARVAVLHLGSKGLAHLHVLDVPDESMLGSCPT
jgi:hypothetical protein